MKKELAAKLEFALNEVFKLNTIITFSGNEIIIKGITDKIKEVQAYLFIHGYLYAIQYHNKKLKIYTEESA